MAAGRNNFTDPNGVQASYDWDINHSTEDAFGKTRQITHSGATSRRTSQATTNTGLVKQQGDDSPMVIKLTGIILKLSQLTAFLNYWQLCNSQTIYFTDFTGAKYEVIITEIEPTRKGVAANKRDFTNMPSWIYNYKMSMEVVTIISGPWTGVTP